MKSHFIQTFEDAIKITHETLRRSHYLITHAHATEQSIESETEQLVIGAYRRVSGRSRTFSRNDLYVRILESYPLEAADELILMTQRRASGEALQYILGYQYFFNHEYEVTPAVLIPRPETELLVFEVIQEFKRSLNQPTIGLEFGLGSGIISIELLKSFNDLQMTAVELSSNALAVAKRNAERILGIKELNRLEIIQNKNTLETFELIDPSRKFDFIVSNPPYLMDAKESTAEVHSNEPHEALYSPVVNDANYFYHQIIRQAPSLLKKGGFIFLECPHERIIEIEKIFSSSGHTWKVKTIKDLNDYPRHLSAQWIK